MVAVSAPMLAAIRLGPRPSHFVETSQQAAGLRAGAPGPSGGSHPAVRRQSVSLPGPSSLGGGRGRGSSIGDGWADVVLPRPEAGDCWCTSEPGGRHLSPSWAPHLVWDLLNVPGANGAALVDVDRDGDLDVLLARVGARSAYVLLLNRLAAARSRRHQRGRGARRAATPSERAACGVQRGGFGDFDRDGRVDVYVTEWVGESRCGGAHERLYRGLGTLGEHAILRAT
jgi:hypothetical protein